MSENRVELSDEQLERLNEMEDAAYRFLTVLAETDDIPCDIGVLYDLISVGAAGLTKDMGRRVRFPTRVTTKDGKQFIVEWFDELEELDDDADLEHF